MSGNSTATICELPTRRLRATWLGRYRSSRTAFSTRSRVAAATGRLPVSTWDTVVVLTPEARATSAMVARTAGRTAGRVSVIRGPPFASSSVGTAGGNVAVANRLTADLSTARMSGGHWRE